MLRVQKNIILKDLEKKMVLLVGPRQAGKTHLAKDIARSFKNSVYLNYDNLQDREIISDQAWLDHTDLLVLDELHKMPRWKNYLKGLFDTKPNTMRVLVTGSARLDIYGDSLAGRYHRHRLLPLSLAELAQAGEPPDLEKLMTRSGFPEPYFENSSIEAARWRAQYTNSLLSTDIFDVEVIHNLKGMRLVFDLLRHRVGSPVSYQSLAEDAGVSPMTIKKYIHILEALFVVFIIRPYARNVARSLLKEPKVYFFDTALVANEGARFENAVALGLLKSLYARADNRAEDCALHYLRTKDGLEVDFAVIKDGEVEVMIEVTLSAQPIGKSLYSFHQKYNYPAIQLAQHIKRERQEKGIKRLKGHSYLQSLYL